MTDVIASATQNLPRSAFAPILSALALVLALGGCASTVVDVLLPAPPPYPDSATTGASSG